jgi:hypothetical protein
MNSVRVRIDDPVFYPSILHTILDEGIFNEKVKEGGRNVRIKEIIGKKDKYVYVVTFRVYEKNSNKISYNYLCYPNIFSNSLVGHLILKSGFSSSFLFKEWGDFYTIIDNSLGVGDTMNEIKESSFELNEHWSEYKSSSNYKGGNTCLDILDNLKKTTLLLNLNDLLEYLDLIIKKDYLNFMVKRFGKEREELFKEIITYKDKDIYLLKDCVFVVRDIDNLLQSLVDKKYKVSQEKKVTENGLTSSSSFLSHLDSDYRHNLYKHHLNKVQHNIIPSVNKLSRSKFSFFNVHQKIGNTRLFTTSCKKFILEDKVIKNRQKLFEKNYDLIRDILEANYNMGGEEVQEKIEWVLHKQEDNFSNGNIIKSKLNFNDETCSYILYIREELCKILSYPNDDDINTKFYSSRFVPLVKTIVSELGVKYVADLLLSYLMEILTKESIEMGDEKETLGIPTITCFNKFGDKIFNRFIYHKYLKSEVNIKGGSLSEFKLIFEKEFKYVYNESSYYSQIGGYFVWNFVSLGVLTQFAGENEEKEDQYFLKLEDKVRELFYKNNFMVFHIPQKLPMVCEPKDHVYSLDPIKLKLGGYLLNDKRFTTSLIKDKIGYEKNTVLDDDNIIVSLINGLSKTPYKINIDTLEYIFKFGVEKN